MAGNDESGKLTKNPLGPSGLTVAANVERLRTGRNLTFAALSDRLTALDRPIPPLGLRKIVAQTRRVDADDLVALAVAFDVSPATLLMPAGVDVSDPVYATGIPEPVAAIGLWEWLRGRLARPGLSRISIDTWPGWEQEQVLGEYAGRADGDG